MFFQCHLQMHRISRETLQVPLQFREFLPKFALKLLVRAKVFRHEIPSQRRQLRGLHGKCAFFIRSFVTTRRSRETAPSGKNF